MGCRGSIFQTRLAETFAIKSTSLSQESFWVQDRGHKGQGHVACFSKRVPQETKEGPTLVDERWLPTTILVSGQQARQGRWYAWAASLTLSQVWSKKSGQNCVYIHQEKMTFWLFAAGVSRTEVNGMVDYAWRGVSIARGYITTTQAPG